MRRVLTAGALISVLAFATNAQAIHFYRGPGGGCAPRSGLIGDDAAPLAATVLVLHNTYADAATGLPVVRVPAGSRVLWTWNSEHCHSVTAGTSFDSGFFYPAATPATPQVLPGLFDHPVPTLGATTLSFTRTFSTPGIYQYSCVHHAAIGMVGVVVVE